ncbi:hypothetical protein [Bradyrhizobium diazoefficiens]
MKVSINPAGFEAEHLAALNRSFGDWGDGRRWRWCFARSSLSEPADIVVAEVNGAAIAGTGISYRRMITPDGGTLLAANPDGGVVASGQVRPRRLHARDIGSDAADCRARRRRRARLHAAE